MSDIAVWRRVNLGAFDNLSVRKKTFVMSLLKPSSYEGKLFVGGIREDFVTPGIFMTFMFYDLCFMSTILYF